MMSDYGLYLHIPFCQTRCSYCDFNTYAGLGPLISPYVQALRQEIAWVADSSLEPITAGSVYFGGGTPSLLPAPGVAGILRELDDRFDLPRDVEITLESNPSSVSESYLRDLHAAGVNRLSLGMQSASPEDLVLLDRNHNMQDVIRAVKGARKAGFENLSLDLIFGLSGQTLEEWRRSLELAVRLAPEHLSLYGLILEAGTPMNDWVQRGLLCEPDPDLAGDMYELALDYLFENGYAHYEISNWALEGDGNGEWECRHNLNYWRMGYYLGFGAGAHGYNGYLRIANVNHPRNYIQRVESWPGGEETSLVFPHSPATGQVELLDEGVRMSEFMLMGLRLVREGVSQSGFKDRFGVEIEEVYGREIQELVHYGLLEETYPRGDCLRLTRRGCLLGNQVFLKFI